MDGNGVVPRLALHLANLHDGVSDSLEVAAVAIGSPVDDVELCDLLGLPRLGGRGDVWIIFINLAPNSIQQTLHIYIC